MDFNLDRLVRGADSSYIIRRESEFVIIVPEHELGLVVLQDVFCRYNLLTGDDCFHLETLRVALVKLLEENGFVQVVQADGSDGFVLTLEKLHQS